MDLQNPIPRPPHFKARMASGLVVLIPLVVTVAVIRFLFNFTSGILLPIVDPAVDNWPAGARAALSFAILIGVIYLLGLVARNILGRRILQLGESVVLRVPFVKVVYSVSKQVVAAFQGQQSKAFKSVVFVEFPRQGMRAVGFLTGELEMEDGSRWNTVFIPTTPNPTTGFLQILPVADVVKTGYTVEEGIKMIMSLGALAPGGDGVGAGSARATGRA
ncbi:MAG TPA: DUF502 domain-containing protein [Longimicrobiales bacterium]|nr:DUF502 domain-containing protein [Longimicrobiales bacterium]